MQNGNTRMESQNRTIFVSIASYRDTELKKTVADALAKAKYPDRIYFGICNQANLDDRECFLMEHPRIKQIIVPTAQTEGACWARWRIMTQLLDEQEFFFQIDSHSRFEQDWDEAYIQEWENCHDPKAVLSSYPINYHTVTEEKAERTFVRFTPKYVDEDGFVWLGNFVVDLSIGPNAPEPTAFIAAGNMFTKSSTVKAVVYDPYLCFMGEEQMYAVRLWTSGYNIYIPTKPYLYHDYLRGKVRICNHWWTDHKDNHKKKEDVSRARILHQLGAKLSTDEAVLQELYRYTLGTVRTLGEWQLKFGIHFQLKLITHQASNGMFAVANVPSETN